MKLKYRWLQTGLLEKHKLIEILLSVVIRIFKNISFFEKNQRFLKFISSSRYNGLMFFTLFDYCRPNKIELYSPF